MQEIFEERYELLKIEAKIDYYLDLLENALKNVEPRASRSVSSDNIFVNSKELLDVAIMKLNIVKNLVVKTKEMLAIYAMQDALNELMKLRVYSSQKTVLPYINKMVNTAISDIESSIVSLRNKEKSNF
ncbi:hypothetical protein [Fervidicoccus sp.]|uniref:hypothetical protein n=1 Tax=Fervidicoccus sp. TaxID=2060324 RepID=UPI003D0DB30B